MKSNFITQFTENAVHAFGFLETILGAFVIAYVFEKFILQRKNTTSGPTQRILSTKKITMIGMFSAVSGVLMFFDFPLPFIAPVFYELDLSDIPALICAFAYGPVAGVFTEFCKVLIKLVFKPSNTALVGELANFAVGCSLILPASIMYQFNKTKKMARLACITGTACISVFASVFNIYFLLPAFALLYQGDAAAVAGFIEAGSAIMPLITDIYTFALFAVLPFNLIKGIIVSICTLLVYKPLSPMLKDM